MAAEADGVHLPSGPDALSPEEVRSIFAAAGTDAAPVISVSCHTLEEVCGAQQSPDCILFAPVFEKVVRERIAIDAGESEAERPGFPVPDSHCWNKLVARLHQYRYSRLVE